MYNEPVGGESKPGCRWKEKKDSQHEDSGGMPLDSSKAAKSGVEHSSSQAERRQISPDRDERATFCHRARTARTKPQIKEG